MRFILILSMLVQAVDGQPPAFEVASVKAVRQSGGPDWSIDPGRFRFSGPLGFLIIRAYSAKSYQMSGPAWLRSDFYEVNAKLPYGAGATDIPAMLRTLLAERFGMIVHWEAKPRKVYALVVAKTGHHLKASKPTAEAASGTSFNTKGQMEFKNATLTGFTDSMSSFLDRPVVNMTGIEGRFDISLNVSMEQLAGMRKMLAAAGAVPNGEEQTEGAAQSIFSAVQELGLKLEPSVAPVKYLVVDEARKVPTGN